MEESGDCRLDCSVDSIQTDVTSQGLVWAEHTSQMNPERGMQGVRDLCGRSCRKDRRLNVRRDKTPVMALMDKLGCVAGIG